LSGLRHGFKIFNTPNTLPHFVKYNYQSVTGENKSKFESRLLEEIVKENYVLCEDRPQVISSRGAVLKCEQDIKLIHDLSTTGWGQCVGGGHLCGFTDFIIETCLLWPQIKVI
jgi:hypothetical protein